MVPVIGHPANSISIHALREEGDKLCWMFCMFSKEFLSTPSARRATFVTISFQPTKVISIHALREEGDLVLTCRMIALKLFLSTPSARRATQDSRCAVHLRSYFYPRPPRGGRHKDFFE